MPVNDSYGAYGRARTSLVAKVIVFVARFYRVLNRPQGFGPWPFTTLDDLDQDRIVLESLLTLHATNRTHVLQDKTHDGWGCTLLPNTPNRRHKYSHIIVLVVVRGLKR